jgi:hypothetical protein
VILLLLDNKLSSALLCYLNEGIAAHFHDSGKGFFHELKEFPDDCLEEVPVGFEEFRVLSDDVHDVGCDDGLVVLALLLLAEVEECLA